MAEGTRSEFKSCGNLLCACRTLQRAAGSPAALDPVRLRNEHQALFRERCQEAKALGMAIARHKQVPSGYTEQYAPL